MNKRIQELADQCWGEYFNTGPVVFNKEKFAELIVSECATLVDGYVNERTFYFAGITIREHFGIEE